MSKRTFYIGVAVVLVSGAVAEVIRQRAPIGEMLGSAADSGGPGIIHNPEDPFILKEREERRIREVNRAYQRVRVELDAAAARKMDVSALEPIVANAMDLAKKGRYGETMGLLTAVELQIPKPSEGVVVFGGVERSAVEDLDPEIQRARAGTDPSAPRRRPAASTRP